MVDRGRVPGPTLLAKLLFEVLRDETEGVRDEVDDAMEVFLGAVRPPVRICGNDVSRLSSIGIEDIILRKDGQSVCR